MLLLLNFSVFLLKASTSKFRRFTGWRLQRCSSGLYGTLGPNPEKWRGSPAFFLGGVLNVRGPKKFLMGFMGSYTCNIMLYYSWVNASEVLKQLKFVQVVFFAHFLADPVKKLADQDVSCLSLRCMQVTFDFFASETSDIVGLNHLQEMATPKPIMAEMYSFKLFKQVNFHKL